jgi:hypothetical protein
LARRDDSSGSSAIFTAASPDARDHVAGIAVIVEFKFNLL